jgi:hypothetical protein
MNTMISKTLIAAITAASCGLMAVPGVAADTSSEPMAMFYWHQTFGGSARSGKEVPSYGFAVSRSDVNAGNAYSVGNPLSFLQGGRPALVDMRFNDAGLQSLNFNGLNSLERKTVYNAADGTTETSTQVNWGIAITGVIVGAAVLDLIHKDDECTPVTTFTLDYVPVDSCGNPLPPV